MEEYKLSHLKELEAESIHIMKMYLYQGRIQKFLSARLLKSQRMDMISVSYTHLDVYQRQM